jgi:RHS repeat-associated protein
LDEPLTEFDKSGIETAFTYDSDGNLTKTVLTADSVCTSNCSQTTTYAVCESTTCTVGSNHYTQGETESSTDPRGYTTTLTYDSYRDVISSTDPLNNVTVDAYDSDGRLYCQVSPKAHAASVVCPSSESTRNANTTSYNYDADSEQLTVTDPDGNKTTLVYDADGNVTSVTDPMTNVTETTYDADDRPTTVTDGYGSSVATTTRTTYDIAPGTCPSAPTATTYCTQTQVGVTGNTTTDYYDAEGRLIETTPPANSSTTTATPQQVSTTYTYDPAGNVLTMTDAAGTTNYSYDALNRNTQVTYANTATGYTTPNSVCYSYDPDNNRTEMLETTCGGTATSTTYTYNGFERPVKVLDDNANTVTYAYDADGDLTCISYPNAPSGTNCTNATSGTGIVTYTYDHDDRMASMSDWLSHTVAFTDSADSELTGITYPTTTASSLTYAYDNSDNLTSTTITDKDFNSTSPYNYSVTALTLNADEQVATSAEDGGSAVTIGYDADTRLSTGETDTPSAETFTYDQANRLTSSTPSGGSTTDDTYDADSELCAALTSATPSCTSPGSGTTLYGYNAQGERCYSYNGTATTNSCTAPPTVVSSVTYGWDQAGRLVCATVANSSHYTCAAPNSAKTTTYTYNGDGLRLTDTPAGGTQQKFTYDTTTSVPRLLADGGQYYLYGPLSTPIEAISTGGTSVYLVSDNQGVRFGISQAGANDSHLLYASYGTKAGTLTGITTGVGFAGSYLDSDGLIYMINRYYDPATGQFFSLDPAGSVTNQPYGYANEDPVNEVDPSGLISAGTICGEDGSQSIQCRSAEQRAEAITSQECANGGACSSPCPSNDSAWTAISNFLGSAIQGIPGAVQDLRNWSGDVVSAGSTSADYVPGSSWINQHVSGECVVEGTAVAAGTLATGGGDAIAILARGLFSQALSDSLAAGTGFLAGCASPPTPENSG